MQYQRVTRMPLSFRLLCLIVGLFAALPAAAAKETAAAELPVTFNGPVSDSAQPSPATNAPPADTTAAPATKAKDMLAAKAEDRARLEKALKPLSDADVKRYKRILKLQEYRRWHQADRVIDQLDNKILVGPILFNRYLNKNGYRPHYKELARWMSHYPDVPGADRVYKLALRLQPRHNRGPALLPPLSNYSPSLAVEKPDPPQIIPNEGNLPPVVVHSRSARRAAAHLKYRIHRYLHRDMPTRAKKLLLASSARHALSKTEFARTLASIATSYFYNDRNEKALALAEVSAANLRGLSPQADWIAGLSAWKLNDCATAARHFEYVAQDNSASRWQLSAGAFWAARARLACHEPEKVDKLLRLAASHSRTFYGLIAARQLGQPNDLVWDLPPLSYKELKPLLGIAGVQRAIALAQVGQQVKADLELKVVWQRYMPDKYAALLGLAARLNLPTTQVKVAKTLADQATYPLDSALYPLPDWKPKGGYSLDRALIFAFMRQESEFNPHARSVVGALGLMQLMPNTASFISRDRSLRGHNRHKLLDPAFNMQLGQRYINHLMDKDISSGNLFLVASAYNGGPGNVARWLRKDNFQNDPLLFIESIPLEETRGFVARVISNLWIYQMRTGHPTPSLDAVAAGKWPIYKPMDKVGQNIPPGQKNGQVMNARD